jgi:hypothetical protein
MPSSNATVKTLQLGIAAGFVVCFTYPLMVFAPLPKVALITLAACFGPALAVSSYGLYRMLDLDVPRLSSRLGLLLNALAGALFTAMVLVQLAVRYSLDGEKASREVIAIWLGLDVAWDAYIGLGTLCFALAMLRHPRLGQLFAFSGLAVAVALLALNFYSFPTPPGEAGLVDLGPAVGLWYLAVTIQMRRSLPWARERLSLGAS